MNRSPQHQPSALALVQAIILIATIILLIQEVIGHTGYSWFYETLDGRIQAIWFVLAGVALYHISEGKKTQDVRREVLIEGGILTAIGLLVSVFWKIELLLPLGVTVICAIPLLSAPRRLLWPIAFLFMLTMPLFAIIMDLDIDWAHTSASSEYINFWSPLAALRRVFVNGYYPVIAYLPFVSIGIWLGGKNLERSRVRADVMWLSLVAMLATFVASAFLDRFSIMFMGYGIQGQELFSLFALDKIYPMPLFIANTLAWTLFLITTLMTWVTIIPEKGQRYFAQLGYKAPFMYAGAAVICGLIVWLGG
ncbi:MAG: hypothetical protein AB8F95_10615 [Bacteroidia bacterium]